MTLLSNGQEKTYENISDFASVKEFVQWCEAVARVDMPPVPAPMQLDTTGIIGRQISSEEFPDVKAEEAE